MTSPAPELSVIVPLYDEQSNVQPLYSSIIRALEPSGRSFELLFIDDGSRDGTFEAARRLAANDRRLKLIRFRRNYGQTPAMAAGIDHASGRVLVTMDGDLQNDPRDVLDLVAELESGADIAVGWRANRQDKLITRKVPSKVANWLIGIVTGVPIKDNGCSLKAYRAEVIKSVPLYCEMHRFIPAMSSIAGARIAQRKVRHHARRFGRSKYGLSRVHKVLFDLLSIKTITAFSARPLRWFAALAAPFFALALIFTLGAAWAAVNPNTGSVLLAFALAMVSLGAAGFLVICGILGELVFFTGTARPENFLRGALPPADTGTVTTTTWKR